MNTQIIQQFLPLFFESFKTTVFIGLVGTIGALIIGIVLFIFNYQFNKVSKWVITPYLELFRNIPLMVFLFFMFYGLPKIGININALFCAIIGLTLMGGAYMYEALRSSFTSISFHQQLSAQSLGLSKPQTLRYVLLPQMIQKSLGPLIANALFLFKETSVVSAIGIMDLMFRTKDLLGLYYQTNETLFLMVLAYLILLIPLLWLSNYLEKRWSYQ